MSDELSPAKVRLTDGLGGFFTEAMVAAAQMEGEQEARAYRGYCPACKNNTLKAVHRDHGIVAKACNACGVLVVLKDA
jgi:uncharacterized protein (DUF983 family)